MSEKIETSKVVGSSKDDNVDTIVEKIVVGEDKQARVGVYLLYSITQPMVMLEVNLKLQIDHPLIYKELKSSGLIKKQKQNSGCMVVLLLIIAPTILFSLLVF
jgi:hypothetical protein